MLAITLATIMLSLLSALLFLILAFATAEPLYLLGFLASVAVFMATGIYSLLADII